MDFYFDENTPPRIAAALNVLEGEKSDINVFHTQVKWKKGVKDPSLYPLLKEVNGILVTCDLKMMTRRAERQIIQEHAVSVIIFTVPPGSNFINRYQFIFKKWEAIKKFCKDNKPPFMGRITAYDSEPKHI